MNNIVSIYRRRMEEVYSFSPVDLGNTFLTDVYHGITSHLKTAPFLYIVPLTICSACAIAYLVGAGWIVHLASLLQYGF